MQIENLYIAKPSRLEQELHRFRWERVAMCEIQIKIVAAYQDVAGVWRFEESDSARLQDANSFVQDFDQGVDGDVLNDMKTRHRANAGRSEIPQMPQGIILCDIQPPLLTLRQQQPIQINATRS
jgi:hypothetical protein